MLEARLIFEVHIGDAGRIILFFRVVLAVADWSGSDPFEVHDVFGEGACLVGEDEVHHPKLLVQRRSLHLAFDACIGTHHHPVPLHPSGLEELDHLKCNEK